MHKELEKNNVLKQLAGCLLASTWITTTISKGLVWSTRLRPKAKSLKWLRLLQCLCPDGLLFQQGIRKGDMREESTITMRNPAFEQRTSLNLGHLLPSHSMTPDHQGFWNRLQYLPGSHVSFLLVFYKLLQALVYPVLSDDNISIWW